MVSPPLMGSCGVIPLTIISTLPDIMRHMSNIIVRAEKEVILATNYWQNSVASKYITNAMKELSKRAGERGDRIVFKLEYDRGSPKQLFDNHLDIPEKDYTGKAVALPAKHEIPNIDLEVTNYHRPMLGTFHCKYMVVDRKVAVLQSNNIQDNDNLEMMTQLEGPIVDSLYDMALISWHKKMIPPLPSHNSPAVMGGIEASAKKGRNQHTGPRNPSTPPEKKDPFEGTIRGTKRKNEHYDHSNTPRKAEVLSIVRWEDSKPFKKRAKREDIFKFCGVSETRGYAIIQEKEGQLPATARTFHNDPRKEETRGSKSQLTEEHLKKLEDLITSNGFDGRALSWDALAEELEVPGRKEGTYLSGKTIQRHMRERGWKHCIACRKHWLSDDTCDRRVEWAKYMLEKYPEKEDWWKVLFSDEVHFSFGPQGRIYILRRPSERNCPDCIQQQQQKKKKRKSKSKGKSTKEGDEVGEEPDLDYKLHAWAAIGHDYKSELVFYDAGNSNGKMTAECYISQILEPYILPLVKEGRDFVLEEDGDSGHGYGKGKKGNMVRKWKEDNKVKTYKNCSSSPDITPVENTWTVPKAHIRKFPHNDIETLRELALEGWAKLSQETINKWVDEMPQRLQDNTDAYSYTRRNVNHPKEPTSGPSNTSGADAAVILGPSTSENVTHPVGTTNGSTNGGLNGSSQMPSEDVHHGFESNDLRQTELLAENMRAAGTTGDFEHIAHERVTDESGDGLISRAVKGVSSLSPNGTSNPKEEETREHVTNDDPPESVHIESHGVNGSDSASRDFLNSGQQALPQHQIEKPTPYSDQLPEHTTDDPHYDVDIAGEVARIQNSVSPRNGETRVEAVTRHLNHTKNIDFKGDGLECPPQEEMTPYIPHPVHEAFPMALVCREPYGTPNHHSVSNPQNATWLSALRNAKKNIFIQSPTLNAEPLIPAIIEACERGVDIYIYTCLGYNDTGELLPMQGGTNEMIAHKLYTSLSPPAKQHLHYFFYTAKDMTHPIVAKRKKRSCHIKVMIVDESIGIQGNGNQDTQSWYHSQEINVMFESRDVCRAWIDALRRNQNTHLYGEVSKEDGVWRDERGAQAEGVIGVDPGRFSWARGFVGAIERVRGTGDF
ncbi:hypothetical protein HYFRA_00004424 [Hymenoscyphus fraxineus]|uniref:PLD phosphodiesterase domain-containing protein n=1 Tax=Hymenoscyphus fraxineus TaxID=746836 RepID=A0A9N9KWT0_9HELO|nr:hypothetical protein HYFRA_00004424 [Hymenoscyphus fraxineus]